MGEFLIGLSEPNLHGNEKKYINDAIDCQWVSITGSYVNKFQKVTEDYVHTKYVLPMQNATAGLHMSLVAAGIKEEEEVIVPTLTFIASVNCVKYVGAQPVFMDCATDGCMDIEKLSDFLKNECVVTKKGVQNLHTKRFIRAIIVTHVFGNMADMEELLPLAEKYQLKVIEDAAQSLGTYYTEGRYKGKYAGTLGEYGVYSYNSNKIITCGSGGSLVIKDPEMAQKILYLITQAKDDGLRYIHNNVGYNYRMNNLQAAVGVAQMEKLEEFIHTKEKNYNLYQEKLKEIEGVSLLSFQKKCRPNYWFYSLIVDSKKYGKTRDDLMEELHKERIQTRPVWGLIHKQLPYRKNYAYKIEQAYNYEKNLLNLPCGSGLTMDQVEIVVDAIKKIQEK